MKQQDFLRLVYNYTVVFSALIIHELAHWAVALFFWILFGWHSGCIFPYIVVRQWYTLKDRGWHATVYHQEIVLFRNLTCLLVTSAPATLVIAAVVLSVIHGWMWLITYIAVTLHVLWISDTDEDTIVKTIKKN